MSMSPRLLRPRQTLHVEALNWQSRVVANGGTVSGATLSAVSRFCRSIDSAGIRSKFYRLNLFAGTATASLTNCGCVVPLYRGPAYGGATYGGATDTVNSFAVTDYVEGSGLTGTGNNGVGAGSSKYLNTALAPSSLPSVLSVHVSAYLFGVSQSQPSQSAPIGIRNNTAPVNRWGFDIRTSAAQVYSGAGNTQYINVPLSASNQHWIASRTSATSFAAYINGASQVTDNSDQTANLVARTNNFYVAAQNTDNVASAFSPCRLGGYSIGLGLDDSQSLALSTAWSNFNAAMGRS